jgi:hypothetical protein
VKHLAQDNILPVGILRGVFSNMNIGPKSNKMPYVFTNPPADTEIYSAIDRVFVLSQKVLTSQDSVDVRSYIIITIYIYIFH